MSSTRRSGETVQERHEKSDYYVTPVPAIEHFLTAIQTYEPNILKGRILDPCAGGDASHPMSYPTALMNVGVNPGQISTIDIREDSLAKHKANFLAMDGPGINGHASQLDYLKGIRPDLIISNPPFLLANEFISRSLDCVSDAGFVVMLLRLNFLGSRVRKEKLWDKHMPKYIFVHSKRMKFIDDPGKNGDSVEYAHFVWQNSHVKDCSLLRVI